MSLEIIGAAYPRTGTLSLKFALEQLHFGPCYHMKEIIDHPELAPLWLAAADGRPDWETIFKGFRSSVDAPACFFWREILEAYPKAKIILTERDPQKWFESVNQTVFSNSWKSTCAKMPLASFFMKLTFDRYGDRLDDREFMIGEFIRYTDEVKREAPREQLLIYRSGDGWGPLCEFLGVPVPAVPYPQTNSRGEMTAMMAEAAKRAASGTADDALSWNEGARRA